MEMSRLARDGTPEPVSRDQLLRREREILIFFVRLTTCRPGILTRLIQSERMMHSSFVLHSTK